VDIPWWRIPLWLLLPCLRLRRNPYPSLWTDHRYLYSPQADVCQHRGTAQLGCSDVADVVLGTLWGVAEYQNELGDYIRHKAEENVRFSQMSEEQKVQALAGQVKFWTNFSYAVGIVAVPLSTLIFSLIYFGAFNLFRGRGALQSGVCNYHACVFAYRDFQHFGFDYFAVEELWGCRSGECRGYQPEGLFAGERA